MVKYSGELGKVLKRLSTYLLYTFMGEKTNDYCVFRSGTDQKVSHVLLFTNRKFCKRKGSYCYLTKITRMNNKLCKYYIEKKEKVLYFW